MRHESRQYIVSTLPLFLFYILRWQGWRNSAEQLMAKGGTIAGTSAQGQPVAVPLPVNLLTWPDLTPLQFLNFLFLSKRDITIMNLFFHIFKLQYIKCIRNFLSFLGIIGKFSQSAVKIPLWISLYILCFVNLTRNELIHSSIRWTFSLDKLVCYHKTSYPFSVRISY